MPTTADRFAGSVTNGVAQSRASAQHVAVLGYQLNDIGMMLASGQSPFMLMMQQGPQVVQVLQAIQMASEGLSIGDAIKEALTAMLSPLSLVTMAIIGLGAAALQWFFSASEEAETLGEAISDLESRVRSYRTSLDDALVPMAELRKEWGNQATSIREVQQAMVLLARVRALDEMTSGVAAIREEPSGLAALVSHIENMGEQAADAAAKLAAE